ncbi:hypothetical protein LCGC14_2303300, partial [marine sediment metagenome]
PDDRGRYGAPVGRCTVDLTPRRCRQFKPKDGQKLAWTFTSEGGGKPVASGTVPADRFGLVTIEKLAVTKVKGRIVIEAAR